MEIRGLEYLSYSTGSYGQHKSGGVTLQFIQEPSGNPYYVIFNADLKRKRNSKNHKVGSLLPQGRFSVGMRSHFVAFWRSTGLSLPPRMSSFHDYMGKLKKCSYAADLTIGNRLDAGTLRAIKFVDVKLENLSDTIHTNTIHFSDNCQTVISNNHSNSNQQQTGIGTDLTASIEAYDISKQEGTNTSLINTLDNDPERAKKQTNEEWLAEYDRFSKIYGY